MTVPVKYPAKLAQLHQQKPYTIKKIVDILETTERTVYRWTSAGFLDKELVDGVWMYTVNEAARPDTVKSIASVRRNFSDEELEEIYTEFLTGKRQVPPVDIGKLVQSKPNASALARALNGLDDLRELIVYMIRR